MKAIGLDQPYATLIALGHKQFETRHFTPERFGLARGDRIAIHANKTTRCLPAAVRGEVERALIESGLRWPFLAPGKRADWHTAIPEPGYLPFGAIVCTATLADWIPTLTAAPARRERAFGDWSPGRWAWLLTDVVRIDPVPWKGRQGAFEVQLP